MSFAVSLIISFCSGKISAASMTLLELKTTTGVHNRAALTKLPLLKYPEASFHLGRSRTFVNPLFSL